MPGGTQRLGRHFPRSEKGDTTSPAERPADGDDFEDHGRVEPIAPQAGICLEVEANSSMQIAVVVRGDSGEGPWLNVTWWATNEWGSER